MKIVLEKTGTSGFHWFKPSPVLCLVNGEKVYAIGVLGQDKDGEGEVMFIHPRDQKGFRFAEIGEAVFLDERMWKPEEPLEEFLGNLRPIQELQNLAADA